MGHRDELGAALARISALERELAAVQVARASDSTAEARRLQEWQQQYDHAMKQNVELVSRLAELEARVVWLEQELQAAGMTARLDTELNAARHAHELAVVRAQMQSELDLERERTRLALARCQVLEGRLAQGH